MLEKINIYVKCINSKLFKLFESLPAMTLKTKPSKINCKNIEQKNTTGSIPCRKEELDLGITLKGGQSFR